MSSKHIEVLRYMVAKLAAHVRPTCSELWAEAERVLNSTVPPSAPVGVGELLADLETIWHSVSDDKETNAAYQRLKRVLAQQPGGESCS